MDLSIDTEFILDLPSFPSGSSISLASMMTSRCNALHPFAIDDIADSIVSKIREINHFGTILSAYKSAYSTVGHNHNSLYDRLDISCTTLTAETCLSIGNMFVDGTLCAVNVPLVDSIYEPIDIVGLYYDKLNP